MKDGGRGDFVEWPRYQKPNLVDDSVSLAAEPPFDLGRNLRIRFDGLSSDNARIAGTDLFDQYSWAKP